MDARIVYDWLSEEYPNLMPDIFSDGSSEEYLVYLLNPKEYHAGGTFFPIDFARLRTKLPNAMCMACLSVHKTKMVLVFPDSVCTRLNYEKSTTFDLCNPNSLSDLSKLLDKWVKDTNLQKKTSE